MSRRSIEVAVPARALLGEGPLWDDRAGVLYWVDILRSEVHRHDPRTGNDAAFLMDQSVGSLALLEDGALLGAAEAGFALVDLSSGRCRVVCPVNHGPRMRMNDGKVDPRGRFWAGSVHLDEQAHAGALYRYAHGTPAVKILAGVTISNGLAWSQDQQTMYFIDTATREVAAYEFDPDAGTISGRRVVVRMADDEGAPDGMAVDSEGHLWIALWDGWAVRRYAPDGELLEVVDVPVARPTCPTFGGADLRRLYITSASIGVTTDLGQPSAGAVFVIEVDTAGTPSQRMPTLTSL